MVAWVLFGVRHRVIQGVGSKCLVTACFVWLNLLCTLVLTLGFALRTGKSVC